MSNVNGVNGANGNYDNNVRQTNPKPPEKFSSIFEVLDKDHSNGLSTEELKPLAEALSSVEKDENGNFKKKGLKQALKNLGIKVDLQVFQQFYTGIKNLLPQVTKDETTGTTQYDYGKGKRVETYDKEGNPVSTDIKSPTDTLHIDKESDGGETYTLNGTSTTFNKERKMTRSEGPGYVTEYNTDESSNIESVTTYKSGGKQTNYIGGSFDFTSENYNAEAKTGYIHHFGKNGLEESIDYDSNLHLTRYHGDEQPGGTEDGITYRRYETTNGRHIRTDWVRRENGKIVEGYEKGRHYTAKYNSDETQIIRTYNNGRTEYVNLKDYADE